MQNIQITRRDFIKFLGLSALSLSACNKLTNTGNKSPVASGLVFEPLSATGLDELILPKGFEYTIIKSWGDEIAPGIKFGFNNDFVAFFALDPKHALLWVNHESIDPKYIPDIEEQRRSVGGSVLVIEKDTTGWKASADKALIAKYNRRYDANSPFVIKGPVSEIYPQVSGTLANCSGGKTPWNTVLSCEENYENVTEKYHWPNINLEHYGWVVEIDPCDLGFAARKHSSLGRFAHENACLALSKDKRLVVYMGDDSTNEHIYKYISNDKYHSAMTKEAASELLDDGKLYVAKFNQDAKGEWLLLDIANPLLKNHFASQAELLINTRKAAKILGATPMARPEDLELSPLDGSIYVALTQNLTTANLHGSILKIKEADHIDLFFEYEDFVLGGLEIGLSCPDNLAFDAQGNLWVTTDVKGQFLNTPMYKHLGNNSLFMIPVQGENAGKAFRFASAPIGAELTGPCFSDDYKTLFLSVQHPGEDSDSSLWPHDPNIHYPRPSVVGIELRDKT